MHRPARAFAVAVSAFVGCGIAAGCGYPPAQTPESYAATERTVAAEVLHCAPSSVSFEQFAGYTKWARGCGGEVMVTCLEPGSFSGPTGECFPMQNIKRRASFDLACPVDGFVVVPLDHEGRTVGVSGCGKRAVYEYVQVSDDRYDWTPGSAVAAQR